MENDKNVKILKKVDGHDPYSLVLYESPILCGHFKTKFVENYVKMRLLA